MFVLSTESLVYKCYSFGMYLICFHTELSVRGLLSLALGIVFASKKIHFGSYKLFFSMQRRLQ